MNNIKQICTQLIELWDADCDADSDFYFTVKLNELRAALTAPEPEEPTDEELMDLAVKVFDDPFATDKDYARAVLARWGSPAPQPIPVTERLPGDQPCWWFEDDEECGYGSSWTLLRIQGCTTAFTHWLPANAIPNPLNEIS